MLFNQETVHSLIMKIVLILCCLLTTLPSLLPYTLFLKWFQLSTSAKKVISKLYKRTNHFHGAVPKQPEKWWCTIYETFRALRGKNGFFVSCSLHEHEKRVRRLFLILIKVAYIEWEKRTWTIYHGPPKYALFRALVAYIHGKRQATNRRKSTEK